MRLSLGNKNYFPFYLLLAVLISSCQGNGSQSGSAGSSSSTTTSNEAVSSALRNILKPVDSTHKKKLVSITESQQYVYQSRNYQPLWVGGNNKPNDLSDKLIAELDDIRWDGLSQERYNLSALKKMKADLSASGNANAAAAFDTAMTFSYLLASKDLLLGQVLPADVDSTWHHQNDSLWDAPRQLAQSNGYISLGAYRSEAPAYGLLRNEYKRFKGLKNDSGLQKAIAAVQGRRANDSSIIAIIKAEFPQAVGGDARQTITAYQGFIGLQPTGKTDKNTLTRLTAPVDYYLATLAANMERMRWTQRQWGDLYVLVNVPMMELFFRNGNADAMHMRVVVGRPDRQTPSLYAKMANVIINPSWEVPPTILKKDVLPGLEKSGSGYMNKKDLKAFDREGNVVDPSFINEDNYKNYTYKQAPGDDNALGYIKFNMPNPWDIYMHDTPHRDDFAKPVRFFSSGCIRVQQPMEMALYVLNQIEGKNYTQQGIDSTIASHKTTWKTLEKKIPVHIAYLTSFADSTGQHVRFVNDEYHRDDRLIAQLGSTK